MADPEIAAQFGRPFPQQVAAFRARLGDLVPTRTWTDLDKEMHNRAFMVAGAMKADLLEDLAKAVDRAVTEGVGLEEFKKDFFGAAQKHGWSGWTGDGTKAGRHWRARVVYRTNIRSTYAAGRLAQLREKGYNYWIYFHGGSLEPREEHLSWNGLILPSDHPWWATHAPPNGWGCSCYIIGARSMRGAIRLGGDPDKVLPANWQARDPRTGAPVGIDKGWDYAPGASVSDLVSALTPKLKLLPDQPSIDLIRDWLRSGAFEDWLKSPRGFWPVARMRQDDARSMGIERPTVFLSEDTLAKQTRRHPDLQPSDYAKIQSIIENPNERIREDARNTIYLATDPQDTGYTLVIKAVQQADALLVTSFRRLPSDPARLRSEIARLRRKSES